MIPFCEGCLYLLRALHRLTGLPDGCRFSESGSLYIEPGSPWENPFMESFQRQAA